MSSFFITYFSPVNYQGNISKFLVFPFLIVLALVNEKQHCCRPLFLQFQLVLLEVKKNALHLSPL